MARLIKSNDEISQVQPKNGTDFQLDELRGFVGGHIEIIHLSGGELMVVNEEGKLLGLPVNGIASAIACRLIVGDVLICKDNEIK